MTTRIGTRIQAITVTALVGMAALIALATWDLSRAITDARELKTRDLVQTAQGVLTYFEGEERAGRLSRDAAQKAAVAAVRGLRYAGSEYFWIQDMAPRMVFHPKAELIGTDLSAVTDPSGKRFFAEMVEVVKTSGGGSVPYLWLKPGVEQPVAKISYVQGFAPWGWIIGSGIYADDTAAQLQPTLMRLLGGAAVAFCLIAILATLIGRGVTRPIRTLTESMEGLASGRLDQAIPKATHAEEIDRMIGAVQVFKDNLIRTRQLEADTAQARLAAEAQRKAGMRQMADGFEPAVGGIIGMVSSSATELQATAGTMSGTVPETAAQSTADPSALGEALTNGAPTSA
ncbi:cache domain-containing protein, partial [Methylobacterium sp. J-067]|uniref:cache domain-containing protein n=1 Tax=Methylobacterium sp. J-067 TaxID=2836648 RepID=UPI001FB906DB